MQIAPSPIPHDPQSHPQTESLEPFHTDGPSPFIHSFILSLSSRFQLMGRDLYPHPNLSYDESDYERTCEHSFFFSLIGLRMTGQIIQWRDR